MKRYKIILLTACIGALLTGVYCLTQYAAPPSGQAETPTKGAAQFAGRHDIKNSPYFAAPDIYNMHSNKHLLLLENFKTRQQITGYTCAPAAAAMVVEHFLHRDLHDEMAIAKIMGTSKINGTSIKGVVKYFQEIGWEVRSSASDTAPQDYAAFQRFVRQYLEQNTPIIVENVDWGGHYRVIIGYDSMDTEYGGDDVLLLADPFDLADQIQDGYNVVNAQKFYYMWFDAQLFPSGERQHPWIAAWPKK